MDLVDPELAVVSDHHLTAQGHELRARRSQVLRVVQGVVGDHHVVGLVGLEGLERTTHGPCIPGAGVDHRRVEGRHLLAVRTHAQVLEVDAEHPQGADEHPRRVTRAAPHVEDAHEAPALPLRCEHLVPETREFALVARAMQPGDKRPRSGVVDFRIRAHDAPFAARGFR